MRAKGACVKGWILLGNIIRTSLKISIYRHNIQYFVYFFVFKDIPNSSKEAEMMISLGILPTHTIVLNEPAGKKVVNFIVETV